MVLTSFYTATINLDSENLIISRMTISDIFGVFAIGLYVLDKLVEKSFNIELPVLYKLAFLVCLGFFLTVFTSLNVKSTIFETLIVVYVILLSFVVYDIYKDSLKEIIYIIVITSLLMSSIGLYDLFAANNNWYTIFNDVSTRHASSGFRYFAQAGNYSFTLLTLFIPLNYSSYVQDNFSLRFKWVLEATILLTILFMIASGAISIMIAFGIGALLFLIQNMKDRILVKQTFGLGASLFLFCLGLFFFARNLYENLLYRIKSRVTHRDMDTPEASFIIENFRDTIQAFQDNFVFGSGLGGFVNNYSEFEIHGTYLKVLGETGLVGSLLYFVFLFFLIRYILNSKSEVFQLFLPFLIASLVSWSYNYHFRKKEFWLLFAVLMIIGRLSEKSLVYEKK